MFFIIPVAPINAQLPKPTYGYALSWRPAFLLEIPISLPPD
jgi:hypothetical protein